MSLDGTGVADEAVYPDLRGQCAVVTGGGGGIGIAIAERLGRSGCDIALLDLPKQQATGESCLESLRRSGVKAMWITADVLSSSSLENALSKVEQSIGPIRILVNSAGKVVRKAALELCEDDWDAVVDVCAKGTFLASQAAARRMREHGAGSIINLSSIFGLIGVRNRAAYAASKAAVIGLSRVLAIEWQPYGIRVNVLAPAFVRTPMTESLLEEGLDVLNKSLLAPLVEPTDVAAAASFLASGVASRMVTGQVIVLDGGWTIW